MTLANSLSVYLRFGESNLSAATVMFCVGMVLLTFALVRLPDYRHD
jgi:hypothetical protein